MAMATTIPIPVPRAPAAVAIGRVSRGERPRAPRAAPRPAPEAPRAHGPEPPDRGAAVRERPRLDRMDPQEREEPDEARETPGDHAHGVRRLLDRLRAVVPRERPAPGPKEAARQALGRGRGAV